MRCPVCSRRRCRLMAARTLSSNSYRPAKATPTPWALGAIEDDAAAASSRGDEGDNDQKSAFESAKELGTVEAWQAFLSNFPSGFYADLARAYVKKLGGEDAAEADPASRRTGEPRPKMCPNGPATMRRRWTQAWMD